MRLPSTPTIELLRSVRDDVRTARAAGRVIVGVGGRDTTMFAGQLAAVFREGGATVFRARAADFLRPRALREGRTGADVCDTRTLRRVLIDPFRDAAQTSAATGFQLAAFDSARDVPVEARWVTGPTDAVLVIDGTFVLEPALGALWDWRIELVTAAVGTGAPDAADNPAAPVDADTPAGALADTVVDVTDPRTPKRVH